MRYSLPLCSCNWREERDTLKTARYKMTMKEEKHEQLRKPQKWKQLTLTRSQKWFHKEGNTWAQIQKGRKGIRGKGNNKTKTWRHKMYVMFEEQGKVHCGWSACMRGVVVSAGNEASEVSRALWPRALYACYLSWKVWETIWNIYRMSDSMRFM